MKRESCEEIKKKKDRKKEKRIEQHRTEQIETEVKPSDEERTKESCALLVSAMETIIILSICFNCCQTIQTDCKCTSSSSPIQISHPPLPSSHPIFLSHLQFLHALFLFFTVSLFHYLPFSLFPFLTISLSHRFLFHNFSLTKTNPCPSCIRICDELCIAC